MKKLLALFTMFAFTLAIVGCGGTETTKPATSTTPTTKDKEKDKP